MRFLLDIVGKERRNVSADGDEMPMKSATHIHRPSIRMGDHASPFLADARRKKRREGERMEQK